MFFKNSGFKGGKRLNKTGEKKSAYDGILSETEYVLIHTK